jgi:phosphoglycolate phosphatase-like HAD superfamily hydrolase
MRQPDLLALDFDGVLCDGLIEYFQTAWRAYCQIWQPADQTAPAGLAEQFYRLRPVVETGWEMPLVLRSLLSGISEADILQNWGAIAQAQVAAEQLTPAELAAAVDGTRDEWIKTDLDHWLSQHRFYPGVIEKLQHTLQTPTQIVIISTKEKRFILRLLQQSDVELTDSQVIGKDIKQPKAQTLRDLLRFHSADGAKPFHIWFVEDRFKTLRTVQPQFDPTEISLFLADWGYNTAAERQEAQHDPTIHLISLTQFSQNFAHWL